MLAARRLIPCGPRSASAPRRFLRAPTGRGESPEAPGPRPPPPSPEAAPGLRPAALLFLVPGPGVSPRVSAPAGAHGRRRGPGRGCRCPQSRGLCRATAIAVAIAAVCFHPLRAGGGKEGRRKGGREEGREGRREVPECPQRHFPHAAAAPSGPLSPQPEAGGRSPRPGRAGQHPAPLPPVAPACGESVAANVGPGRRGPPGSGRGAGKGWEDSGGGLAVRGSGAPGKGSARRGCETARGAARGWLPCPGGGGWGRLQIPLRHGR